MLTAGVALVPEAVAGIGDECGPSTRPVPRSDG